MNVHFISDTHFGHDKVIRICNRPFTSLDEMREAIIQRYNERVGPDDICYFVGDIFFCNFTESLDIAKRLNGKKMMVLGNHDKHSITQYYRMGFLHVMYECKIHVNGVPVVLSHYPYKPPFLKSLFLPKTAKRYYDRRPHKRGWLIHGHVHNAWKTKGKMINIGCDQWNFYPVHMKEISRIIATHK